MRGILSRAVVAFVTACLPAHAVSAAITGQQFVEHLYARYGTSDASNRLEDRSSSLSAPRLLAAILADWQVAKGDVGKLDEDPLCDCQDVDGFYLSHVATRIGSAGRETAIAMFELGATRKRIRLDLVSSDGTWKIADIHSRRIHSLLVFLVGP